MDILPDCILLPHLVVRLHINFFNAIQGYYIKFPDRFIVFRRISGSSNHPAVRNFVASKGFALQELQHSRGQRLRNTVDLIQKQDTF